MPDQGSEVLGAVIGLFSKYANEEDEDLLDRSKLEMAGKKLI